MPVLIEVAHEDGPKVRAKKKVSQSFVHLDMMRALASLLVLFGHLRSFVFVSYDQISNRNLLDTLVWAVTGFGHQAVMIFFVLSGFFITRSIVSDDLKRGFSWPVYGIKRLSRLWVVLIPALLLTALWDHLGTALGGAPFYSGMLSGVYNSGPAADTGGVHLDLAAFFGNVFFLQTIRSPVFGSDGPLWSLANEFWYYLLFPLLYVAATRRAHFPTVAVNLLVFVAVCIFIGKYMVLSGLIWLLGAGAYYVYDRRVLYRLRTQPLAPLVATLLVLLSLGMSKSSYGSELASDLLIGLASAVLVVVLAELKSAGRVYNATAGKLADASYTIYLVHFPFLALLTNVLLGYQKFDPSLVTYSIFFSLAAICLAYCYLVYWLFERHTGTVRRYCLSRLSQRAAGQRAG
jgi:peptidoglycan/LPS O-acetylase OafA/YrhL